MLLAVRLIAAAAYGYGASLSTRWLKSASGG
jgi:hypothetical protein